MAQNQLKLNSSSSGNYHSSKFTINNSVKSLAKTAGANYSVRIMNLPLTKPQITDTLIQIMNLQNDTTIDVYLNTKKRNIAGILMASSGQSIFQAAAI